MKKRHPSIPRKFLTLLPVLMMWPLAAGAAGGQSMPLLRKQAAMTGSPQAQAGVLEITIQLNGLQPEDVINLRPGDEERIAAAAGAVVQRDESAGLFAPVIQPGVRLPDEALEVGPRGIVFHRPVLLNQVVFVDIQVPRRAQVRVQVGGQNVLRAALREPLALRNQAWAHGSLGVPGALARAAGLQADATQANEVVFDQSRGGYVAPARLLTPRRRQPLKGAAGAIAVVALSIDENGHVVSVVPLTSAPIEDLEKSLLKWRFAPLRVDGRAVPVTTLMQVTADS